MLQRIRPQRLADYYRRLSGHPALPYVALLAILLLAVGLRWYAAASWNEARPNSPERLYGDEPQYDNLARSLWQGYGFDWPGRTPLYPLWLAGVYWLSDGSYLAVPYAQILLGLATVYLIFRLGCELFGRAAGLIAALLGAGSYTLIHQSLHVLTEVLYAPALLIVALAMHRAFQRPSLRRFLWLGLWIGVSNLVRPTLVLFPAFVLLLLLVLRREHALRYAGACALAAALTVAPWVIHNYVRHNVFYLMLAPSNAILWQGSPEYYRLLRDEGYTYMRVWGEVIYGPGWQEHDPMSVEGDRWWTQRALRSIAAEPHIYLIYFVEKLGTYWVGDPEADWNGSHVFDYRALRELWFSPRDAKLVMLMRAIPIVALAAALWLRRSWRRLLPVYAILIYCTLLHAATHAEARLSEPLQPLLLVIVAGAFVSACAAGWRDRPGPAGGDGSEDSKERRISADPALRSWWAPRDSNPEPID